MSFHSSVITLREKISDNLVLFSEIIIVIMNKDKFSDCSVGTFLDKKCLGQIPYQGAFGKIQFISEGGRLIFDILRT